MIDTMEAFGNVYKEKGIQIGIQQGIQKGEQQGVQKSLKSVILNCIALGYSNKQIAEITSLSPDEIEQYRLETQKNSHPE